MLVCLRRRGVRLAKLVLHAGVASLESHERPYEEQYEVPVRTAEEVRRAKERGGRIIAVGTTVVRALESSVDRAGHVIASRGWTDLVITPERGLRVVDGLLTGLHEPRATHLAMLEALAGRAHVEKAYAAALEREVSVARVRGPAPDRRSCRREFSLPRSSFCCAIERARNPRNG